MKGLEGNPGIARGGELSAGHGLPILGKGLVLARLESFETEILKNGQSAQLKEGPYSDFITPYYVSSPKINKGSYTFFVDNL